MATPVVAAAALLVRQYFMDGFYPSGRASPSNSYTPSGVLLKGVLLGGAVDMIGTLQGKLPLDGPLGPRQGFGRVNLTNSLGFSGGKNRLQVSGCRAAL